MVATEKEARGKYEALDFGMMGTLTHLDKNYMAQDFLALSRTSGMSSICASICGLPPSHLERWMSEQIGWCGLLRTSRREAPFRAQSLPAILLL